MIFLPIWLCAWVFGEVFAARTLLGLETGEIPWLFLGAWLLFWTMGGASALMALLWMLSGRERILLTSSRLSIRKELYGLRRVREYDAGRLKNFRVAPRPDDEWEQFGNIAFDYGASTIRFGAGIEEAEARSIIDQLLQA